MECVWTNSLSRPYAPRSWVLSWVVLNSTPSAWVRAVSLVGAVTLVDSRHGVFQDEDHRGWLGLSGTHLESFPFKIPSELGIPSTAHLREGPMEMGGGLRIGEGGSHFQPLGKCNLGSPWRPSGFCMQQGQVAWRAPSTWLTRSFLTFNVLLTPGQLWSTPQIPEFVLGFLRRCLPSALQQLSQHLKWRVK